MDLDRHRSLYFYNVQVLAFQWLLGNELYVSWTIACASVRHHKSKKYGENYCVNITHFSIGAFYFFSDRLLGTSLSISRSDYIRLADIMTIVLLEHVIRR